MCLSKCCLSCDPAATFARCDPTFPLMRMLCWVVASLRWEAGGGADFLLRLLSLGVGSKRGEMHLQPATSSVANSGLLFHVSTVPCYHRT